MALASACFSGAHASRSFGKSPSTSFDDAVAELVAGIRQVGPPIVA